MALTHFGTASKRAKASGKPHIWWDGSHWNAVTPDGYSGHLAATPTTALEYAQQGPEFFRRLDALQPPRESRVWLSSDRDSPRPNTQIVC